MRDPESTLVTQQLQAAADAELGPGANPWAYLKIVTVRQQCSTRAVLDAFHADAHQQLTGSTIKAPADGK